MSSESHEIIELTHEIEKLHSDLVTAVNLFAESQGKWASLQNDSIQQGFAAVVEALNKQHKQPQEIKFMFIVKDDNPDVTFSLVLGDVTDAEGNVIPDAQLDLAVASTDETVVGVTFDAATKSGSVHFGNPGTATVTATASSGGTILGSGAADFTVTTGDPAAITGVKLNFDGITETP